MIHPDQFPRTSGAFRQWKSGTSTNALACVLAMAVIMAPTTSFGQTGVVKGSASVKEVSPVELQAMLDTGRVFIYDCNEKEVFEEMHVSGAVPLVYDQFTAGDLPEDHGAVLVFYCYNPECPAGATAAKTAVGMGYSRVLCMIAGITGWQDAGLGTEP